MKLLELFSPDLPRIRDRIVMMVLDAKENQDWNELERFASIFAKTPYFDHKRNKQYVALTTDENELKSALVDATYYDDYYIKRLLNRMQGEM